MNQKVLFIALILALALSILVPMTSVGSAGIPNPNHVIYVSFGGPETVDPAWAYDTASAELLQNVYEPLCMYEAVNTSAFRAMLADSWPGYSVNLGNAITPSPPHPAAPAGTNQTWYFHIRENVPWHDSAYGFVLASDVEYSIERGMLMDHTGGPQWMLYSTLTGNDTAYDWDYNGNGKIDSGTEFTDLMNAVKGAVESNSTHVWFNLPAPFAPFQQVLCMSCGYVLNKNWAISKGCWNGDYVNYTEFVRTFDPPLPGPLMTPPVTAMGTGPYKLVAIDTDPHTGRYELEKFDAYWQGWPAPGSAGFAQFVTVKNVEEWANRKAQFFSTDPGLQSDISEVLRPNVPEVHIGGNKDGPTYPGFRMTKIPAQTIGTFCFNYNVSSPSDYMPKLGSNDKPDLFSDRDLRLAFQYSLNVTELLHDYLLGEALQPNTCMAVGTAFYNNSKIARNIDLAKAEAHFRAAWGGQVWSQGMTVKLTVNIGGTARQTLVYMMADVIMHRIPWPEGVFVNIIPTMLTWSKYMVDMPLGKLPVLVAGWLADFPDPHDWFVPFMDPFTGDYAARALRVTYGLNPTGMAAEWYDGASYGPPPYTNALGERVTEINNTYVKHVIDEAVGAAATVREKLYNELMDIYYAEGNQLPVYQILNRVYLRSWLQGWEGTYNENPVAPGYYFYTMWKAPVGLVYPVDISAQ